MKTSNLFGCLSVIVAVLLTPPCTGGEDLKNSASHDARVIAERLAAAIRDGNTAVLASAVDPKGIGLGFDSPPIAAERFKQELLRKRGAYCVIFDISCAGHKLANAFSLRQTLAEKQTILSVAEVQGFPETRVVAIKSSANPNEVLFSLYLRHAEGKWVLQQIEYF